MRRIRSTLGLSLLEIVVALGILGVGALLAMTYLANAWRHAEMTADRVFAYERAQSILEELRTLAEAGVVQDASELDAYDEGTNYSYALTMEREGGAAVAPSHPASMNVDVGGTWRYARRVSVRPVPGMNMRDLRMVTVSVFLHETDDPPGRELARVTSVVRTLAEAHPPTQVYDVYMLAIENVPGWWVHMASIQPFVEASLRDVQARNPGLEFRVHWITKLGYGRNPQYTPYFNDAADSNAAIPNVYFYPSKMPAGNATDYYYIPRRIDARINVDGEVQNGWDATSNPWPYALADQYNHCMRLPRELELFEARRAAGQESAEEPTWRMLLEDLNSNPDQYRNAIIVNLHGELLPMPPLRNYSDAAREPVLHPGVRVVTHPEKLRFVRDASVATNSQDVKLRVYSYKTDPSAGATILDVPIIVEIKGLDLTASINAGGVNETLGISTIRGGVDINPANGTIDPYTGNEQVDVVRDDIAFTPPHANKAYARVRAVTRSGVPYTVVELHNSPLVCPQSSGKGLAASDRLYGMEYVPCPTEAARDFSKDLNSTVAGPRNTARWVITLHKEFLGSADRRIDVTTRLGSGSGGDATYDDAAFSTGIMYPPADRREPENVSTTYTWWATSAEVVPFTERYQFQGDPRHCPYADLMNGGQSFPNGYNWYFDDLENLLNNVSTSWPALDAGRIKNNGTSTDDGWKGRCELDVPRFLQLLRGGLVNSETVWTSLTGWSYYYMGVGNEIGYDSANGYALSIPVSGEPFGGLTDGYEDSITTDIGTWGRGVKYVRGQGVSTYWWCKPWLGELCPDADYSTYWRVPRYEYSETLPVPDPHGAPKGNLPAGATAYYRVARDAITYNVPTGTTLRPAQRRLSREGCTSVFNTGTSTSTFHHRGQDGTYGDLSGVGTELGEDFRFPLPTRTKISRPFSPATNADGGTGDEFAYTTEYPRYTVTTRKTYFGHDTGLLGSSLLEVGAPSGARSAYQLVHGLDRTLETGSAYLARYSMLALIHGYLSAAAPTLTHPLSVRPRVRITGPNSVTEILSPTTIDITWTSSWERWDEKPYTRAESGPRTSTESVLRYIVMWSNDNGSTWHHVQDGTDATPGVPNSSKFLSDANDGAPESYTWSTPAGTVPMGAYLLRVEAYVSGAARHYSYHEERIFIDR